MFLEIIYGLKIKWFFFEMDFFFSEEGVLLLKLRIRKQR